MTRSRILAPAFALVTATIIVQGCRHEGDSKPVAAVSTSAPVARVAAVRPERKTMRRSITQPGQIEPFDRARLYAKIPAYVERYHVDIGDKVTGPKWGSNGKIIERGQLLVELSAPELDQDLQQKKALVAQANADVEQAQAAIKVAQAQQASDEARLNEASAALERVEAEFQRWTSENDRVAQLAAKSVVTQKLADETKAQLKAADAARQETKAHIESAKAVAVASRALVEKSRADEAAIRARRQVAEAEEARAAALVNYLKIEAPFDGFVAERNADIGYFAEAGGGSHARPLFTVVRVDPVRVFLDIPEMDASLVNPGDRALVRVDSLRAREFSGTVTRMSSVLDESTRTLHTEVDIPNADAQLRPGMYAQVTIDLAEHRDACTVPASAVIEQDGQTWCFVVAGGKALRKPVTLGLASGGDVEVASGLSGDELVILGKGGSLKDGQSVEVMEATASR